ncbi:hypothetical protein H1D32_07510 [Anaerobacillus sp. CMMVII]|uniref:hypothetical protein n=1 Tax=Anaerobacillus sp. CMMVII TaxID=2755588 RepID=UPI0021B72232|nr:hypothetical protein [Anaerobacillus sp. CMMVII]MCT8137608.1 hypothetical protein [Anaerobacillus sp. CMMVII]
MDFDAPVKIVARNFHDFLRIMSFSPNALDIFDISTNKSEFKETTDFNNERQAKVREMFTQKFQLEPIDSLYEYLQKVKQERENEIVVTTEDGIGVVNQNINLEVKHPPIFDFEKEENLTINNVKLFLKTQR